MHTPWMLIVGCAMAGWILTEALAAIAKRDIPIPLNIMGAVAGGLIAGFFVL